MHSTRRHLERAVAPLALALCSLIGLPLSAQSPPAGVEAGSDVALHVKGAPPDGALSPGALQAALERELGRRVRLADGEDAAIAVDVSDPTRVQVRYLPSPSATPRTRAVDVSGSGEHQTATLALVLANLVRDEASELLAGLEDAGSEAEPRAEAEAPPTPTPEPPKPEAPPDEARGCDPRPLRHVGFGADLIPHVGTSSKTGIDVERGVSLNLLGGTTAAVRGIELALGFNHETQAVCGVQLAGGVNLVGGPVEGVQMSLVNLADGRLDGAQLALVNGARGTVRGLQASLVNLAGRNTHGAQLGLVNLTLGALHGIQASLVNVVGGPVDGLQASLVNVASARTDGLQIGLANLGADALAGAQVGLVNVTAGTVEGTQVGLVNVAEDADAAIGLVSVMSRGRTHFDAWVTDAGLALVGVEHGSRVTHTLIGVGATRRHGHSVFAAAYGLGARLYQGDVFVDLDAIAYGLYRNHDGEDNDDLAAIAQLRVPIGFRLGPVWGFVGPSLSVSIARTRDNRLADPSLLGSMRLTAKDAPTSVRLWPGLSLGMRFM